jgi:hypothetical protein
VGNRFGEFLMYAIPAAIIALLLYLRGCSPG